jgi:hypothetical protein
MKKSVLSSVVLMALSALSQPVFAVYPTDSGTNHVTTYSAAEYGQTGTITFNDWGYIGPNGSGWNDFVVPSSGGFDSANIGQRQKVVTYGVDSAGVSNLDGLTPDARQRVRSDDSATTFFDASMDGQVQFYRWGYTTPAGSTFNNMQIDKNGNYFVARSDMKFGFYDYFTSSWAATNGGTISPNTYDTVINFQPYAISDARGWCGSVLNSNPNGVGMMAGQVTFDFAFDAYLVNGHPVVGGPGGGTQIVPDFVMRSYGNYTVTVSAPTTLNPLATLTYTGNAVMNNTNPLTGALDLEYQNKVSFLGGGVVPKGVWVTADSYNPDGTRKINADQTWQVTVADGTNLCNPAADTIRASDGAHCFQNSFAGYGFLMRADGTRELFEINPTGHSNYVATDPAAYASIAAVPVPAAVWLFGSGLIGLTGLLRRKRGSH